MLKSTARGRGLAAGLCVGRSPRLVRGPGESLDRGPFGGRDHPAICNLLLPWGFAMASGRRPTATQREPPRPREGHAGLLFAVRPNDAC